MWKEKVPLNVIRNKELKAVKFANQSLVDTKTSFILRFPLY